jgi:uncharacterized alpha-E superfamily protein
MKRNRGKVTGPAVAAFLVLEPRFPRSVLYCARSVRERLASICDGGSLPGKIALARAFDLEEWLGKIAIDELRGARVHEVLTHVVNETHAVCDAIGSELLGQPPGASTPQILSQ